MRTAHTLLAVFGLSTVTFDLTGPQQLRAGALHMTTWLIRCHSRT